jgi:hypothetical protein
MLPLYERQQETLTFKAIIRAYETTYVAIHSAKPECEYLSGNWFIVNGVKRDRRWLLLEVEYLRQKLIAEAVSNSTSYTGEKRKAVSQVLHILASVG